MIPSENQFRLLSNHLYIKKLHISQSLGLMVVAKVIEITEESAVGILVFQQEARLSQW